MFGSFQNDEDREARLEGAHELPDPSGPPRPFPHRPRVRLADTVPNLAYLIPIWAGKAVGWSVVALIGLMLASSFIPVSHGGATRSSELEMKQREAMIQRAMLEDAERSVE